MASMGKTSTKGGEIPISFLLYVDQYHTSSALKHGNWNSYIILINILIQGRWGLGNILTQFYNNISLPEIDVF